MIPSYFVQLERMPLTANGKMDRKALPEPEGSLQTGVEYVAPRNLTESQLVKIWEEVLGTPALESWTISSSSEGIPCGRQTLSARFGRK